MTDICPGCNSPLNIHSPLKINQSVTCSNCGLEQEVVWLYPLELVKVLEYHAEQTPKPDNNEQ